MDKQFLNKLERGKNLKELINASGFKKQEDFASKVFVESRTLRRWLSNGFDSIEIAQNCADALGISIENILFKK